MHLNTTCTCKACELIPTLDLKFVTHHGTYILSNIAGREELSGVVDPNKIWFEVEGHIPIPPALAWDYLTKPDLKQRWIGADTMKVTGLT